MGSTEHKDNNEPFHAGKEQKKYNTEWSSRQSMHLIWIFWRRKKKG